MRKPFVAGNWKMFTNAATARQLAAAVARGVGDDKRVLVAVCPPFPYLSLVAETLKGSSVALGAQDCYHEKEGAFTGEVSPAMLVDVGCRYVILGHSERRHKLGEQVDRELERKLSKSLAELELSARASDCLESEGITTLRDLVSRSNEELLEVRNFGESDAFINRKVHAALATGLEVILCLGETLQERQANRTEAVLETQLNGSLAGLDAAALRHVVLAYEPVWAIGTGQNATPDQAQQAHSFIRGQIRQRFGEESAAALPIQYGGSVKPNNAAALFRQPDVDGGLIGGASLHADQFLAIVRAALPA
jgi:triosephosphate isomerase